MLYAGVEAGGTKFNCLVGTGPDDVRAEARFPTTEPAETVGRVVEFLGGHDVAAVGIASFGPVEVRGGHPAYGHITNTPKAGWFGADLVGPVAAAFGVPVGFDTDVNGAALGEGRWGAARGLDTFVYLTVGTGVGGAAVLGGRLAHGLVHPEMGHLAVLRQTDDDFSGTCPYHGDCLEGMASGPALAARFGAHAEELTGAELERAVALTAGYLAAGLRSLVYVVAPERIIVGGGVAKLPGLLAATRERLVDELAGYPGLPEQDRDDFVTAPGLGDRAGALGALVLAERAASP